MTRTLGSVKVAGILTTGGSEEEQIFVPLAFAQKMAGQPSKFRRLQVSAVTQPRTRSGAAIQTR